MSQLGVGVVDIVPAAVHFDSGEHFQIPPDTDQIVSGESLQADALDWLKAWGVTAITPDDALYLDQLEKLGNQHLSPLAPEEKLAVASARHDFLAFLGYSDQEIEKFAHLRAKIHLPIPENLIETSRYVAAFGGNARKLYRRSPGLVFSKVDSIQANIEELATFGVNRRALVNEAGMAVQNIGRAKKTASFLADRNLDNTLRQVPILLEMDSDFIECRVAELEAMGFDIQAINREAPRLLGNKTELTEKKLKIVRAACRMLGVETAEVMQAVYDKPNPIRSMSAKRIHSTAMLIAKHGSREEWETMRTEFEERGLNPYRAILRILTDCPIDVLTERIDTSDGRHGALTIARNLKNERQAQRPSQRRGRHAA